MKTITTVEQLDALSDRAVIKAADETILFCIGSGQPDWDGNIWQDEENRWLGSSDVELPATLIHPLVFTAKDVDRAEEAVARSRYAGAVVFGRTEVANLHAPDKVIARAVLEAVGSVEA